LDFVRIFSQASPKHLPQAGSSDVPVHLDLFVKVTIRPIWHGHSDPIPGQRRPRGTRLVVETTSTVSPFFSLKSRPSATMRCRAHPEEGMKSPPSHPEILGILCVRSTQGLIRLAPAGIGRPISLMTINREITMPAPAESPMRMIDVGSIGL
jgi:hypothetical protein